MTNWHLPRNKGAHRTAAVALYRALLLQCRRIPEIQLRQRNELQNIVRNRFKQARHEQSIRRLTLNFEAGYEAIDHLDAAVAGEVDSKSYILDLLERAPEKVKQAPPTTVSKEVLEAFRQQFNKRPELEDGEVGRLSILDRPLPLEKLSGRRHVPRLFSAQGIPVLRIYKPQPENLSGYINHRLKKKQKRHDTLHRLDGEFEMARAEDRWDKMMRKYIPQPEQSLKEVMMVQDKGGQGGSDPSWSYGVAMAGKDLERKLSKERERNRIMAEKMQAVVDQEQELYEKEKAERQAARRSRCAQVKHRSEEQEAASEDANVP